MRVRITIAPLRPALRSIQWALGAGAVLMLGYCGFVLADGWMFQNREERHLEQLLTTSPTTLTTGLRTPPTRLVIGGLVGRIEIPRLGLSVVVAEGVDGRTLRRAVGHIPGTALPGHRGNVGISGHRDTFFRPLRNIRQNDIITLTTLAGDYRYRVVSIKIVSPSEVGVLDAGADEVLTLVTCYPFYFVGPARDRFIVRAERVT